MRFEELQWEREALLGPATRTWWGRDAGGSTVRVTQVSPEIEDATMHQEVEAALMGVVTEWGAAAQPGISLLRSQTGAVCAVCAVDGGGEALADRLRKSPVERDEALDRIIQVAEAAAEWHDRGIAHGFIRPETIWLLGDRVALLEPRLHAAAADVLRERGPVPRVDLYAAPERNRFSEDALTADVFAIGVLLAHLIVGRPVRMPGSGTLEASPLFEALPGPLQRTVAAALHPDPGQRLPGAQKLGLYLRVHRMWASSWDWTPLEGFIAAHAELSPATDSPADDATRHASSNGGFGPHASPSRESVPSSPDAAFSSVGATAPGEGWDPDNDAGEVAATDSGNPDEESPSDWPSWLPHPISTRRAAKPVRLSFPASGPEVAAPSPTPMVSTEAVPVERGDEAPLVQHGLGWEADVSAAGRSGPAAAERESFAPARESADLWGVAAGETGAAVAAVESASALDAEAPELVAVIGSDVGGTLEDTVLEPAEAGLAPGLEPYTALMDEPELERIGLAIETQIGPMSDRYTVEGDRATVGRPDVARAVYPDIDLRDDDAISRRHAEFRFVADGWVVVDLGSTNGTRLNGQWLEAHQEARLADGDVIELGAITSLRVHLG